MIEISKLQDRRMNWIKQSENLSEEISLFSNTYELYSEKDFTGMLFYKDYIYMRPILNWKDSSDFNGCELEIKDVLYRSHEKIEADEKGSDLTSFTEIQSLLSLFYHARFFLKITRKDSNSRSGALMIFEEPPFEQRPKLRFRTKYVIPRLLRKQKCPMKDFEEFLDAIKDTDTKIHIPLSYAIKYYASAIRLLDTDALYAYLKLVIAIEILAEGTKFKMSDDLQESLKKLEKELENPDDKKEIHSFIMQRKKKDRWVQFLLKNQGDFFRRARAGKGNEKIYVTKNTLEGYLYAIYENRSGYVHAGVDLLISDGTINGWDLDPWVEHSIIGSKISTEDKKMPTIFFFEEFARYCMLNYIFSHSKKDSKGLIRL